MCHIVDHRPTRDRLPRLGLKGGCRGFLRAEQAARHTRARERTCSMPGGAPWPFATAPSSELHLVEQKRQERPGENALFVQLTSPMQMALAT